jgi:integrase
MRGHVRKRGKSWSFVIELSRDASGKRRQKWLSGYSTRKQAEAALASTISDLHRGAYIEPSVMLVSEFLERWLTDYVAHNCEAKTAEKYEQVIRNQVIPALGQIKLKDLKPAHIQKLYSDALNSGRVNGRGGLSSRSVHHMHRILSNALSTGVKWQILSHNPVKATTPPKPEKKEMTSLSAEQSNRLLQLLSGQNLWLPVFLGLTTGMRRGEILGLQWKDINWDRKELSVKRSLKQSKTGVKLARPKTAHSLRTISLSDVVIDTLRAQKRVQAEERLRLGSAYTDGGMVLAAPGGGPLRPDSISTAFAAFMKQQSGLPKARFHDLRHTHASLLFQAGENPKVVSQRLGHANVAFTLDTYAHLMPGMETGAASKIDALFGFAGAK